MKVKNLHTASFYLTGKTNGKLETFTLKAGGIEVEMPDDFECDYMNHLIDEGKLVLTQSRKAIEVEDQTGKPEGKEENEAASEKKTTGKKKAA